MTDTPKQNNTDSTLLDSKGAEQTLVQGKAPSNGSPNGRYSITKTLGKGAMGVVYLAHDSILERDVAIKELHSSLAANADLMERFRREAKVLAKMTHPGVVQIYDLVEDEKRVWIVMEFVKGQDLSEYLQKCGKLPANEVRSLGAQMAEALAYAHSQGIVHRDFKPGNVLLTSSGIPKIMDFGIAKLAQSAHQTMAGTIMGTPSYMSPEQASGKEADARADIYSLGVVLYHLSTGKLPFTGELASILTQHITTPPKPPREVNADVPEDLQKIILSLLEKDPSKRTQDMTSVAGMLRSSATAPKSATEDVSDIEAFLEKRQSMEKAFNEKFERRVTVMFTDLKGSTTIAEREGDLSSRLLIKKHNDIVFPIIKKNNGVLVKTMGDGTLSYFNNAQDGLRAGAQIQLACEDYNVNEKPHTPIIMRIGLHTGACIVEEQDIFGDVVNTASRFESNASPGEVCFSEETYNALSDKNEIYCRFHKMATLKGKSEPFKLYKAFWNKSEIEEDIKGKKAGEEKVSKKGLPAWLKLAIMIAIPIIIIIIITQWGKIFKNTATESSRSIEHSTTSSGQK